MSAPHVYVYVAAPYSGDVTLNVRRACVVAEQVQARGGVPFVPHLSHLWDLLSHRPYEEWLEWCLAWVERCDLVVRLEGASPGATREVERAAELGIPCLLVPWNGPGDREPWENVERLIDNTRRRKADAERGRSRSRIQ